MIKKLLLKGGSMKIVMTILLILLIIIIYWIGYDNGNNDGQIKILKVYLQNLKKVSQKVESNTQLMQEIFNRIK